MRSSGNKKEWAIDTHDNMGVFQQNEDEAIKREQTMGFHVQKTLQNASKSVTESGGRISGAGGTREWGMGGGGLAGRAGGLRADGCAHCLNCGAGLGLSVDHIKLRCLIMCGLLCISCTPNKAGVF